MGWTHFTSQQFTTTIRFMPKYFAPQRFGRWIGLFLILVSVYSLRFLINSDLNWVQPSLTERSGQFIDPGVRAGHFLRVRQRVVDHIGLRATWLSIDWLIATARGDERKPEVFLHWDRSQCRRWDRQCQSRPTHCRPYRCESRRRRPRLCSRVAPVRGSGRRWDLTFSDRPFATL